SGVRSFIVNSAGFGESDEAGRDREAKIVQICREANVPLLGPNCLGLINAVKNLPLHGASFPDGMSPGNVGVIAQSGSASIAIMNSSRAFEFSYVVSTGNEALLTAEDVLESLLQDSNTEVIVLFLEALRQPRRFAELALEAHRRQM